MPHASLAALRCRADSDIVAYGNVAFTVIAAIAALSTSTEVHVFFRWNNSIVCFRAFRRHRGRHQPARATPFAVCHLPWFAPAIAFVSPASQRTADTYT